jgi:hypothetical protein
VGRRADPLFLFLSTAAVKRYGGKAGANWSAPLTETCRREMLPLDPGETVGPERLGRVSAMALFGMARRCMTKKETVFAVR